ncbi:MAG: cytochrome c biogenesis protein CcsA [Gemmatimonadales bacterium]
MTSPSSTVAPSATPMAAGAARDLAALERAAAKPMFGWLFLVGLLAIVGTYIRAIYFTPPDALQGVVQKLYYLHFPTALGAYIAVCTTALCSIVYLWLHDERADRLAEASAEVGLVFLMVVMSMGSIWGHVIWGTWWAWWDLRLALTLFLWFVVAAYLVLRGAIDEPDQRGRYSAVLGILGALLIPFIHLSVYFTDAHLHPMPVIAQPGKPKLPSQMLVTFLISFASFTVFCIGLIRARYRLGVRRDLLAALDERRERGVA